MTTTGATALLAASTLCITPPVLAQTPLFGVGGDTEHLTLQTAFSCPLGQLSELYASLSRAEDVLDVMAVETEVLAICRARQERLQAIAQAELELRRVLGIENPARAAARVSIMEGENVAPLVLACAESEVEPMPAAEPEATPSPAVLATPATSPLQPGPREKASVPAADIFAALLAALDDEPAAAGGGCNGWSWMWTGRDHSRRYTALIVSPDGARREVAIGDRLPSGQTVVSITSAGVVIDDAAGNSTRLPPFGGGAPAPSMGEPGRDGIEDIAGDGGGG